MDYFDTIAVLYQKDVIEESDVYGTKHRLTCVQIDILRSSPSKLRFGHFIVTNDNFDSQFNSAISSAINLVCERNLHKDVEEAYRKIVLYASDEVFDCLTGDRSCFNGYLNESIEMVRQYDDTLEKYLELIKSIFGDEKHDSIAPRIKGLLK